VRYLNKLKKRYRFFSRGRKSINDSSKKLD
jgi:hypothetical protein